MATALGREQRELPSERHLLVWIRPAQSGAAEMAAFPSHARSTILARMAALVEADADTFVQTIVLEAGKMIGMARIEVERAAATLRISAEEARRLGGEIVDPDSTPGGEGCTGVYRRFPVGIVLAITPFHFPLSTVCHKLGPALAAGCPPTAISVVPSSTADAERLAADPRIGLVSFTGSPEVGWHLKALAGRKRATLEHGGNAAMIAEPDADLERAAARCVQGGFANAGQVCLLVQRVFLHAQVYDKGLARIVAGRGRSPSATRATRPRRSARWSRRRRLRWPKRRSARRSRLAPAASTAARGRARSSRRPC